MRTTRLAPVLLAATPIDGGVWHLLDLRRTDRQRREWDSTITIIST